MKRATLIFLALLCVAKLSAQQTWKLAKEAEGIKVYVTSISNSNYYAFKAVMSVKTTEKEVVTVLKDVEKYPEWFAFTASARLLSQSDSEQSLLMETDYPWPYANECMGYHMVFEKQQEGKTKVSITGTPHRGQCAYALRKAGGYILLEPNVENITITYYFHSEPAQAIPTWLINPMIHEMPFQTFVALRKKLLSHK